MPTVQLEVANGISNNGYDEKPSPRRKLSCQMREGHKHQESHYVAEKYCSGDCLKG